MPLNKLILALESVREHLKGCIDHPLNMSAADEAALKDARELVAVLQRVLRGQNAIKAFGAPGDWGYHTLIGKGVLAALSAGTTRDTKQVWLCDSCGSYSPIAGMIRHAQNCGPMPSWELRVVDITEAISDGVIASSADAPHPLHSRSAGYETLGDVLSGRTGGPF